MKSRSLVATLAVLCSCAARPYPVAQPMWVDDDRHPYAANPPVAFSPFGWDAADNLVFRPISSTFAVRAQREAVNVNAVDEVPDSSWFTNRIGRRPMSPAEVARGPCVKPSPEVAFPWKVTGAKQDGANPGFQITAANGTRYLLKFDDANQLERASAADVVGSKLYYAAGFHVPCNRIVTFRAEQLTVPESASAVAGKVITRERVDALLKLAPHRADGSFRAMASEWLSGKPIGPWTYDGVRPDDPNDVVNHEDRRDLRGSRLLGAWLNHFDARAQNTLAMFIPVEKGTGYVEHYIIDWGDTLGSIWDWDPISRRLGYNYYFDLSAGVNDFGVDRSAPTLDGHREEPAVGRGGSGDDAHRARALVERDASKIHGLDVLFTLSEVIHDTLAFSPALVVHAVGQSPRGLGVANDDRGCGIAQ